MNLKQYLEDSPLSLNEQISYLDAIDKAVKRMCLKTVCPLCVLYGARNCMGVGMLNMIDIRNLTDDMQKRPEVYSDDYRP